MARLRAEVVGGIARVILFEEGLREVQPGEMLVTPITTAGWTCIFSVISAVVTGMAGILTHAGKARWWTAWQIVIRTLI